MNPEGGDLFGGDYICHGGPPTLRLWQVPSSDTEWGKTKGAHKSGRQIAQKIESDREK